MTKVKIEPGICGFVTFVTAELNEDDEDMPYAVKLSVKTGWPSITRMMEELGNDFDGMALCLKKPGKGELYEYIQKSSEFPGHASCPVINGILKCAEVECGLALRKNAAITFED